MCLRTYCRNVFYLNESSQDDMGLKSGFFFLRFLLLFCFLVSFSAYLRDNWLRKLLNPISKCLKFKLTINSFKLLLHVQLKYRQDILLFNFIKNSFYFTVD